MDVGGIAGKLVASAALSAVRRLAAPNVRERLVSRILGGIDKSIYRVTPAEQKALAEFVARESVWPNLIEPSLVVSVEFVDEVEQQVLGTRREEDGRRALAEVIANLARAELPAAVDAESAFIVISNQMRDASDRQLRGQNAILTLLREQSAGIVSATSEADLSEYRRQLVASLEQRVPGELYDCTYVGKGQTHSAGILADTIHGSRWSVLQAPAGYGKTAILTNVALQLARDNSLLVVHIDLKSWSRIGGSSHELSMELLLRFSMVPVDLATIERLDSGMPAGARTVWIIDGVNELPAQLSGLAVDVLAAYMRPRLRCCLLVADRTATRYSEPDWTILQLQQLSIEEVRRQLDSNGLPVGESNELLRVPFFLGMAISSRDPRLEEPTRALEEWFSGTLKLGQDDLDLLSRLAYDAYTSGFGLSFGSDRLLESVGKDVAVSLVEAEAVRLSSDGSAHFFHQIVHDFLAARFLAQRPDDWVAATFDAVSFSGNAYDCIAMVLNLIHDAPSGDRYLIDLYDWNWFATVRVLGGPERTGPRRYSSCVALAIFALLAEKRLDAVEGSRERAFEAAARIDEMRQLGFAAAGDMTAIARIAVSFEFDDVPDWFVRWRNLFERLALGGDANNVQPPLASDALAVLDSNSIVGWSGSMLLRRSCTSEEVQAHLRTIYWTARAPTATAMGTVRWRVIHALGAYPNDANADLLLDAVVHDPYMWARYGAMRSLIEMAACGTSGLREEVLSEIDRQMDQISDEPLTQLAWASRYDAAPEDWESRIRPMLRRALELQSDNEVKRRWQRRIDVFETWASQRGRH